MDARRIYPAMEGRKIHPAMEKIAVLLIMQQLPDQPFTVTDISERLHYTWRRVQQILDVLIESGLVAQTRLVSGGEIGYVSLTTAIDREA